MEHFLRALNTEDEDRLTCQECQDSLPEFLAARARGQANTEPWPWVALHLDICPHCSAEAAALTDLMGLAYGQPGAEPSRYPAPDLSFLRTEPEKQPWRLDELGRLIIQFSAELLRALQPPTQGLTYATTRHKSTRRTLCRYTLQDTVEDLDVTITVEGARDDPDRCTVAVGIDIPSRGGWPHLTATEVTIKRYDSELGTQHTDAFGKAVFEGIATDDLAHLVFEITPHR